MSQKESDDNESRQRDLPVDPSEKNQHFPVDFAAWDVQSNFNFLNQNNDNDPTISPYSNGMSPMNSIINPIQPGNQRAKTASPAIDYASQLQHYQNLLMETQSMLQMKQSSNQNENHGISGNTNGFDPSNLSQFISSSNLIPPSSTNITSKNNENNDNNNNNQFQQRYKQPQQPRHTQTLFKGSPLADIGTPPLKKKNEPPQPRTKSRPCDHCRRRKTKCLMIPEQHTCKMCQSKGLKCTFNENTTTSLKRGINASNDNSKRLKLEDIDPPPNVPVRDVHPIKDYSSMQGNSLLKKTLSLQYPRSSFYVGPTSIYDPIFLENITLDKIDQFNISKTDCIRKVASDVQFTLRDDFSESLYERSERDSDTVEQYVAPHGKTLIDLYFQTVHPSFPILHKKIFLEKYARTHREFGAPLLAAVYLLAIQWWDYEPTLSSFTKPNSKALYKFAIKTFAEVVHRPKLSAVQAGLLLLQCKECRSGKNWLLSSQVVALSEELGLGLDCSNWRLPKWERGLRRRLAWAVYIQDKWSSLIESRPSHIDEGINWLVKPVSDEDFPERFNDMNLNSVVGTDIELGKECFRHLVTLSMILSEIQDALYTPKAMIEVQSIEQILIRAKPLQLKLRNWYHTLPKNIQMGTLKPRQFNSNGNLQLAYFATEMTLHRRMISSIHYTKLNINSGSISQSPNGSNQSPNLQQNVPIQVIEVCRKAARSRLTAAIDFVRDLKPEHLQAFWHNSAGSNFALIGVFAALLYVTSLSTEESLQLKEQVMDYRWILRVNSRSFTVAQDALVLVDGVLKNIPGILTEQFGTPSTIGTPIEEKRNMGNTNNSPNNLKRYSSPIKKKSIDTSVSSSKNENGSDNDSNISQQTNGGGGGGVAGGVNLNVLNQMSNLMNMGNLPNDKQS